MGMILVPLAVLIIGILYGLVLDIAIAMYYVLPWLIGKLKPHKAVSE